MRAFAWCLADFIIVALSVFLPYNGIIRIWTGIGASWDFFIATILVSIASFYYHFRFGERFFVSEHIFTARTIGLFVGSLMPIFITF